jgi:cobalt-zinc-cadmium efflux system outer membrane protein
VRRLAASALLALALGARAETLTLDEAQAEARRNAPDARVLDARLRGAERVASDAHRLFRRDPRVSASYAPRGVAGSDEQAVGVGLELPLELSGAQSLRGASADAERSRVRLEREEGLRALDEAVAIAFADLALAQRAVRRGERLAAVHERLAAAARRELELGRGTKLDADAADLDLAAARADAAETEGALRRARAELARLLGRSAGDGLAATDASPAPAIAPVLDLDRIVARHPRVAAAAAEVDAARLELAAEERSIVPLVSLGVEWTSRDRSIPSSAFSGGPPGLSASWNERELGFLLSFDLPILDRRTGPRAVAAGRIGLAEARLAQVRGDVAAEVQGAAADLAAAAAAARAFEGAPEAVERDLGLLDRAVMAGSLDAVARAQAVRRLADSAARADRAAHALAVAVARWRRLASAGE